MAGDLVWYFQQMETKVGTNKCKNKIDMFSSYFFGLWSYDSYQGQVATATVTMETSTKYDWPVGI